MTYDEWLRIFNVTSNGTTSYSRHPSRQETVSDDDVNRWCQQFMWECKDFGWVYKEKESEKPVAEEDFETSNDVLDEFLHSFDTQPNTEV